MIFQSEEKREVLIVNLNYTNTVERYLTNDEIIYYHGKLNDKNNPIIFGYGDELDIHYPSLKNSGNEFTKNIKLFHYKMTNNNTKLDAFLRNSYDVHIGRYSCGLSDRLLLNKILNNGLCNRIFLTYYLNRADYLQKIQNLSRIKFKSAISYYQLCLHFRIQKQ